MNHFRSHRNTEVTVAIPGTCGELVQGCLDGRDFLVTFPIDLFARARAIPTFNEGVTVRLEKRHAKVRKTIDRLADVAKTGIEVIVDSDLPREKGFASSSAEMAAAAYAYSNAIGSPLQAHELDRIMTAIEPSDGVHYTGICATDFIRGGLIADFGSPPPIGVVIVDTGGQLATDRVARSEMRANAENHRVQLLHAIACLHAGFRSGNADLIGHAATTSAGVNQRVYPKPFFEELLPLVGDHGIVGVNCAHSGTLLGVMFDQGRTTAKRVLDLVTSIVGSALVFGVHQMIGGGPRLTEERLESREVLYA